MVMIYLLFYVEFEWYGRKYVLVDEVCCSCVFSECSVVC